MMAVEKYFNSKHESMDDLRARCKVLTEMDENYKWWPQHYSPARAELWREKRWNRQKEVMARLEIAQLRAIVEWEIEKLNDK
jgi:hypothetical protein